MMCVLQSGDQGYRLISVGTGVAPTISEVVDFIYAETGSRSKLLKGAIPMRKDEPDSVADPGYLKSICDWSPLDWHTGLKQMIAILKEQEHENSD